MDEHRDQLTETHRLADFTDRLLSGEKMESAAAAPEERELASLEETVEAVQRSLSSLQPDVALRKRIRARLAAEWETTLPVVKRKTDVWRSSLQIRRAWLGWATVILVALVLVGVFVLPRFPAGAPGAAQAPSGLVLIILAGLGIIGLILWWHRKKP